MAKKIFIFGLIFAVTLVLYLPVFKIFLTGDDLFHFKISMTDGSLIGFIKLFGFYSFDAHRVAFYRPIFREATYNLVYHFWGLSAMPLRILSMILHFVNVILVFSLMKRIFKSERVAYLSSFLFSVSAANTGAIYYLAGGLQAQGAALFVFSTLLLFPKHKVWAFVTFILSLMSHELAVVTPVLLMGLMIMDKEFKLKYIYPYFIVIAAYFYADFKLIGFSKTEIQYKPTLNPKTILNNLSWYALWSLGLPETLIDFIGPGLKLNPNLMKYWGDLYKFIFPGFFTAISSFLAILAAEFLKLKKVKVKREIVFLGFWFVVGISTVLLLPLHKSTYYLAISLPAFCGIIAYFLFQKSKISRFLSVLFLAGFAVLTVYSTKDMDITYWAAQRGRLSQRIMDDFKAKFPTLPKGAVVLVKNDPNYPFVADDWGGTSKQASLILSGSDGFELLYKDPSLKVYYQDFGGVPVSISKSNIFEFTAKIN